MMRFDDLHVVQEWWRVHPDYDAGATWKDFRPIANRDLGTDVLGIDEKTHAWKVWAEAIRNKEKDAA